MKFNEKLMMLRRRAGMSQEELAEKLDVSRQAVSRWEAGSTLPDALNLIRLSDLFHVSIDRLLRGELPLEETAEESPEAEAESAWQPEPPDVPADKRKQTMLTVAGAAFLLAAVCFFISAWVYVNFVPGLAWLRWVHSVLGMFALGAGAACLTRLHILRKRDPETAQKKVNTAGLLAAAVMNLIAAVCFTFAGALSGMWLYFMAALLLFAAAAGNFVQWLKKKSEE